MTRREVAGLLGALLGAFVIAGAATSARGVDRLGSGPHASAGPAACTVAERARRQAALAAYRRSMTRKRAAYFRKHRSPALRARFVKAQQQQLVKLKKAAACRVVKPKPTTLVTTQASSQETTTAPAPSVSTTTSTLPTPTDPPKALHALQVARTFLGTPFVYGGSTPQTGFDASGLVQWSYAQAGITLPRLAADQFMVGQPIARDALLAGDLVFFQDATGYVFHVGISSGGDEFIHAPHTGDVIKVSSLTEPYYAAQFAGGRRVSDL